MTKTQIRTLLIALGETKFEDDTDTLDGFIDEGQRILDDLTEHAKARQTSDSSLAINAYELELDNCKQAEKLWAIDSDGNSTEIVIKDLAYILENYPELGDTDSGTPAYAAVDGSVGDDDQLGLLIMPPADEAFTIRVLGRFYSTFDETSGNSWWSVNAPYALVNATRLAIARQFDRRQEDKFEKLVMRDVLRLSSRRAANQEAKGNQAIG